MRRIFKDWVLGAAILIALLLLCAAFGRAQNSNTPSPSAIGISTTGNVITLTGVGTNWTGSPFTLHGGCSASITAQSVSSTTAASVTLTTGTCAGNLYITDGGTTEAIVKVMTPLTLGQPFVVNGTSGNVIALTGFGTSWTTGTPGSPTFALSGCATASITAQTVTSATAATITVTAGTTDCTVTVTDPNDSATATFAVHTPQTYYVRPDGGSRYSTNEVYGGCNGMADAAYPGTTTETWLPNHAYALNHVILDNTGHYETATTAGTSANVTTAPTWASTTTDGTVTWTRGALYPVNQACAFNDYRFLYQDGAYANGSVFPAWGWIIKGGDHAILRGSIGTSVSYRVGAAPPSQTSYCDPNGLCWGLAGDSADSFNPPVPAGIASQHTRILGENYAACSTQSARTQLHGGTGVHFMMNLKSTNYVDMQCLDFTDFSGCSTAAGTCTSADDYASNGIWLYPDGTNITLQDVWVHGMSYSGIGGPPGTGFTATDLGVIGNGGAGWNADPGDGTTGYGTMNVTGFNISWNGCEEEYPIVDALPYAYCRDDSTGGYGDGFGTTTVGSPAPGWNVHFDNGIVSYNTQDGLDALHINGAGTTVSYTRVLGYASEGQQLKVGATSNIQNSQIVGNCTALQQTIPGRPVPTNDNLGDVCRAGNTAIAIVTYPNEPSVFQANTVLENGLIGLEVEYGSSNQGSTNTLLYNDNLFFGFNTTGQYPSPIYSNTNLNSLTNPGASWTHNLTFNAKAGWTCPQTGESSAVCADPTLTDETNHLYGYGNMTPLTGSPAIGAGITVSGVTVDFNGTTRSNPPTIGAFEKAAAPAIPVGGGTINGRIATLTIICPSASANCLNCFVFSPSACQIKVVYK